MTAKKKKPLTLVEQAKQIRFICTKCLVELTPMVSNVSSVGEEHLHSDGDEVLIYLKCHESKLFFITRSQVDELLRSEADVLINKIELSDGGAVVNGIEYHDTSDYAAAVEQLSIDLMEEFQLIQKALEDGHDKNLQDFVASD